MLPMREAFSGIDGATARMDALAGLHPGDIVSGRFLRVCGHTFDSALLSTGKYVIDLGANDGVFTRVISGRYGVKILAVEPNPALFERLPKEKSITPVAAAAGAQDGICRFKVEVDTEASRVIENSGDDASIIEVPMLSPTRLLERCSGNRIALMKIDIEGQEIAVLDAMHDDQLLAVDQFSVEFHAFNHLVTQEAVERIVRRMRDLNFFCMDFSQSLTDVWLVHQRHAPSLVRQLALRGMRVQRGLFRRLPL